MRFSTSSAAALALSFPIAIAQTSTSCNPTQKKCPNDTGLNAGSFTSNFMSGKSSLASWSSAQGTTINFGGNGAEFSISAAGQAPTISTDFYIFFGRIDVRMRASPGAGIVSSIVLLSDDLDEIDWEFLGGNTAQVETNFFGKGNTTSYNRAVYESVTNPQNDLHTYTVDWNSDRIEWIIDGQVVRTVSSTDPLTLGGKNYPQTPMRLKLGNWCGGCSGEPPGTVQWAGGPTNFNNAPYVMYVESVDIQNYNPGSAYEWVGESGSWQSIKVLKNGGSTAAASGSATASKGAPSQQTKAPTKSISVGHLKNTAAAVSTTIKGGNYSRSTGGVRTQTRFTTTNLPSGASPTANGAGASGSAGASASSSPGIASSATSLAILTSSTLLGLLCGFMLL